VVLADSHEIPRAPCYSGTPSEDHKSFAYRTITVYGQPSQTVRLPHGFITPRRPSGDNRRVPQPRMRNARRLSHTPGLASSAFAHHYSRNHNCFLFLRVLRCFTSPRSHQPAYTFSRRRHPITGARLPHSETPGSTSGCRLPEAYRRLPRPSSAPDAKASTVRPKKLEHTKRPHPHPPKKGAGVHD
jgi:hypothetical protein